MKAVLDTNIFIFALKDINPPSLHIFQLAGIRFDCIIPELILQETAESLKFSKGKDFASLATHLIRNSSIKILPDDLVKGTIVSKYISRGAKPADAFIAAFAEWIEADYIVSENRHFLRELKLDNVKVTTAADFLNILLAKKD